jgi:TPR repeat protein
VSGSQRNLQALYHFGLIEQRGTIFFKDGIIKKDQVTEVNPKTNIKRALSLFKYAANHGCLDAQLLYAKIHGEGYLGHHDSNEAFIYYMQAAK